MDRVPPSVVCPDSVSFSVLVGSAGRDVTWSDPTVSDNSGSVSLVFNSHESGSTFGPGQTTVTYIYQDPNNNRGQCEFTITIFEGKFWKRLDHNRFCKSYFK